MDYYLFVSLLVITPSPRLGSRGRSITSDDGTEEFLTIYLNHHNYCTKSFSLEFQSPTEGTVSFDSQRLTEGYSTLSLVHSSPFDDVSDVLKVVEIFQDIAFDDDDIGELPGFDRS